MSDESPEIEAPVRRVSFTVTGYLRGGHPVGGWFDMQGRPDGGQQYSIPQFAVDEASITDLPPEALTRGDWDEITGTVTARLGAKAGGELADAFRQLAAERFGQGDAPDAPRCPHEGRIERARRLADHWGRAGGREAATWRQASMDLHATLDGPDDEPGDPQRAAFEDLLGAVSLYVDWRFITRQLTTEQRNLWADAHDAWAARMGHEQPARADRWWDR